MRLCAGGQTVNLSDPTAPAGGTWSTSNSFVATVSPAGVVTSTGAGNATITYNVCSPCGGSSASVVVTVNPAPAPLSGNPNICQGQTNSFSSSPGGGTWSSSSTTIASVDASGNVTGLVLGSATISYTNFGCSATSVVTVRAAPGAISPTAPTVCVGSTSNLSDPTAGGTWASTLTSVATVGSTGTVGGVVNGNVTITYSLADGCSASVALSVNPSPAPFFVSGGGNYCIGQTSPLPVTLTGSAIGTSYQLFNGSLPVATLPGTGTSLNFGVQTAAGVYTVIGTTSLGCTHAMSFAATVNPNPAPAQFTLSGGGSYCAGGSGVADTLSGSVIGVRYQLFVNGSTLAGPPVNGTGGPLIFLNNTTAGIYTVVATAISTGCTNNMLGSATITIDPLPNSTYTILPAGSAAYCTGGSGVIDSLSYSNTGISYQLYNGGFPSGSPVSGTGGPISFGPQTVIGTYYVIGTNVSTGCYATMAGTSTLSTVDPPAVHNLTNSGTSYCAGGTGISLGMDNSDFGVNYNLYNGTGLVASQPGGGPFSFGTFTAPGTYSVVAVDATYGCTTDMAGTTTVSVNPLPTVYTVSGGGSYCAVGGSGRDIILSPASQLGVLYTLNLGAGPVASRSGTGGPLDFPGNTAPGTYTITASVVGTGCGSTMLGSASITINPPPPLSTVTGGG